MTPAHRRRSHPNHSTCFSLEPTNGARLRVLHELIDRANRLRDPPPALSAKPRVNRALQLRAQHHVLVSQRIHVPRQIHTLRTATLRGETTNGRAPFAMIDDGSPHDPSITTTVAAMSAMNIATWSQSRESGGIALPESRAIPAAAR